MWTKVTLWSLTTETATRRRAIGSLCYLDQISHSCRTAPCRVSCNSIRSIITVKRPYTYTEEHQNARAPPQSRNPQSHARTRAVMSNATVKYAIAVHGLSYYHGANNVPSLSDISLQLPLGSRTIIVGANGGVCFVALSPRVRQRSHVRSSQRENLPCCKSSQGNASSKMQISASWIETYSGIHLLVSLSSGQNGWSLLVLFMPIFHCSGR